MTAPDLTRDLAYDEVEKIILATEVSELSDRGDRVWTRRMAVALADKFNARLSALSEPAAPAGAEVVKALAHELGRFYWAAHHDRLDARVVDAMAEAALAFRLATPQPVEPPDDRNEAARDDEWGEAGEKA